MLNFAPPPQKKIKQQQQTTTKNSDWPDNIDCYSSFNTTFRPAKLPSQVKNSIRDASKSLELNNLRTVITHVSRRVGCGVSGHKTLVN